MNMNTNQRELLTETQAAKRLGLSVKTLQSWRYRRLGPPYIRLGGAVRYVPADLDAWIEAGRVTPGAVA